MSINDKQIGQRMREHRIELGLSSAQVAEDLNFSVEHYWKLEAGTRSPSLETIAFGQTHYTKVRMVLDLVISLLMLIRK